VLAAAVALLPLVARLVGFTSDTLALVCGGLAITGCGILALRAPDKPASTIGIILGLLALMLGVYHLAVGFGWMGSDDAPDASETATNAPVDDDGLATPGLCKVPDQCRELCDQQQPEACEQLASAYLAGDLGMEKDTARGVAIALEACDMGGATGCVMAAFRIRRGDGVEEDPKRALALDTRACDMDETAGCHNVAYAYLIGAGTEKDPAKAQQWYQHSCDAGDRDSCRDLATLAQTGAMGMEKDVALAQRVAKKACADGGAEACLTAGLNLLSEQAADRAEVLFEALCDDGNGSGCNNMGVIYERGLGRDADLDKAL